MTNPTERKEADVAGLVERLREYADPDGRIPFPIVDQDGKRIGVARRTPDELLRSEAFVDDRGTAWMPPAAWAYFAACRARDEKAARIAELEQVVAEAREALVEVEGAATIQMVRHIARAFLTTHRNTEGGPDAERI